MTAPKPQQMQSRKERLKTSTLRRRVAMGRATQGWIELSRIILRAPRGTRAAALTLRRNLESNVQRIGGRSCVTLGLRGRDPEKAQALIDEERGEPMHERPGGHRLL